MTNEFEEIDDDGFGVKKTLRFFENFLFIEDKDIIQGKEKTEKGKKIIKLDNLICSWNEEETFNDIILCKNKEKIVLRTLQIDTFKLWKSTLRNYVILTDFHEQYIGIK